MPTKMIRPEREQPRTNTLLAATATINGAEHPIKVRNLSISGALIESSIQVEVETPVALRRGKLRAQGMVVWREEDLMGLYFASPIEPADWLAIPTQQALPRGKSARPAVEELAQDEVKFRVSQELAYVARLTNSVADALAADPVLRLRHATHLQELCIGEQMLRELSLLVRESVTPAAVESLTTGPMRQRLLRKRI